VAQLSLICLLLYTSAAAVVGTRLLLRSWRLRVVPELLIGLTYFTAGAIGYPFYVLAAALPGRSFSLTALWVGWIGIVFGCSCSLFFTAKIFRPGSRWALTAASMGSLALVVTGAKLLFESTSASDPIALAETTLLCTEATVLVLGLGYMWTAFEGMRHYRMMRRRMALGLADPVTANRFLLWAFSGAVSMVWNGIAWVYLLAGEDIAAAPVPVFAISLSGVMNAVLLILVFMPPVWYTNWLARTARAGTLVEA